MTASLTNVFNVTDDATLQFAGRTDLTTATVAGTTFLVATGENDDGLSVFSVGSNGSLSNVANVSDDATLRLDGIRAAATATVGAQTFLVGGSGGLSVFSVGNDGSLTNVDNVADDATLNLGTVFSLASAVVGGTTYVFAAGGPDNGVSVFSVAADGSLANVANVGDDATLQLSETYAVTTASVGGTTYLFAAGTLDMGFSVFSVGNDGSLANVDNVDDLPTITGLTTSVVDGTTYLFAASNDNGADVYAVADDGSVSHVERLVRVQGEGLATSVIGGTTYLFVGFFSLPGSVEMYAVGSDGSLTSETSVSDSGDPAWHLRDVRSVATAVVDGSDYLFAEGDGNGISVFRIAVGPTEDADTLVGTDAADTIDGLGGDDSIDGRGGDDTLLGGAGDDTIVGGAGNDSLDGGTGTDTLDYAATPEGVISGIAAGVLVSLPWSVAHSADGVDTVLGFERIVGSAFADSLYGRNYVDDVIEGRGGNDLLHGLTGSDSLTGGAGSDTVIGGTGNDSIVGGSGNDSLDGGAGVDTLDFSATSQGVVSGTVGGVLLSLPWQVAHSADGADTVSGFEHVIGSAFDDSLYGRNDVDERIEGGAGADRIHGLTGNDTINGGTGDDVFVFAPSGGRDVVEDFGQATGDRDLIDLTAHGLAGIADLTIVASGATDTLVLIDGRSEITLLDLLPGQVTAADFLF